VRKYFPGGEKEGFRQPGFKVLLEGFLGLEAFGHGHNRAVGKAPPNEGHQESLGGGGDAGNRQSAAFLQRAEEALRGRSLLNVPERTFYHYAALNLQATGAQVK
jgi:hypothetical protein